MVKIKPTAYGRRQLKAKGGIAYAAMSCINCGVIMPYINAKVNRLRCDKCNYIRWTKKAYRNAKKKRRENKEVVVMVTCVDCNTLVPSKVNHNNRIKIRCPDCEYKTTGRVRNEEYTPPWKNGKCRYCGEKIIRRTKNQVFCKKCAITYGIMYSREYARAFRKEINSYAKKYYHTVYKYKKHKRCCILCETDLTNTKYIKLCSDCKPQYQIQVNQEYSRIRYEEHKDEILERQRESNRRYAKRHNKILWERNMNKPGTRATKKHFSMARKANGKPDFKKELEEIQKIKQRTYRQRPLPINKFTGGDYIRYGRRELNKLKEEH